jgi:hypothetical protein
MTQTEDVADVLQAEGESGLETVGFSGATVPEVQRRRARPCQSVAFFNLTPNAPSQTVMPTPVAYWGNFVTTFDGTVIAGAKGDGLGSANIGWTAYTPAYFPALPTLFTPTPGNPTSYCLNGILQPYGTQISSYQGATIGAPGNVGLDFFFKTSMASVTMIASLWVNGLSQNYQVVFNNVPQSINASGVYGSIIARPRPEGYAPGENGVQLLISPTAWAGTSPGWADSFVTGVPANNSASLSLVTLLTP